MTTTVPIDAIATCRRDLEEDYEAKLATTFLFPNDKCKHRRMEYLWGLEIYTIDPTHERSILKVRESMTVPLPNGRRSWVLLPTEETLVAMVALQVHNFNVPISERKSFLAEFSAKEYEYIFLPLSTEVDFFVSRPGRGLQSLRRPSTDILRVKSTANPFFVTFDAWLVGGDLSSFQPSLVWTDHLARLTIHWHRKNLPDEFLLSCYPETLVSESAAAETMSETDFDVSKAGSEETVVTPLDEYPSPVLGKYTLVSAWVQQESQQPHDRVVPVNIIPPTPRGDRTRGIGAYKRPPQWRLESKRGLQAFERHFPSAAARFRAAGP
ncbi:hypothetical protein R3P38DRAFT_2556582 [Favolaschia claudopus]|uniref:Uncharacterized protein n=1 Tax=Favolaschia claudopus TaxID=2862362 RepID=A0AAW0A9I8_9AGAR